jgi:esterase
MVISPDLRNHGKSPTCQKMDYPSMALDIVELMKELELPKASLIGHSMGGKIAMQAALSYAHKVEKIVVGDILPIDYKPDIQINAINGLNAIVSSRPASRKQADEILSKNISDLAIREFLLKNLILKEDGKYGVRVFMESINTNYSRELAMSVTLFIKGGKSDYIQEKYFEDTLHLFPKSQHTTINGAGHWLHVEKSVEFNQIIIKFLNA